MKETFISQIDFQTQCNSYQNPKFICKTGILFKMYKIYIEMQEIKKNQCNISKEQSWISYSWGLCNLLNI